jgi:hypothetical protein
MHDRLPGSPVPWDDDDPGGENESPPSTELEWDDAESFLFRSGIIRKVQAGPDPQDDTRLFIVL